MKLSIEGQSKRNKVRKIIVSITAIVILLSMIVLAAIPPLGGND
ncbi:MAG: hypothetical protein ACK4M9_22275 [Anaerobacillus sp.]